MDSTASAGQNGRDAAKTKKNSRRRTRLEKSFWELNKELQDVAYRDFKALQPAGTPADFVEWLENSVDWMITRTDQGRPEKLGNFSDRTAYRIFRRNQLKER